MKRACYVFVLISLLSSSCNNSSKINPESTKSKAVEAYHQIEGNVFNHQEITRALKNLEDAYNNDPSEPVIYAAKSLAILVYGFKINDWYEVGNFQKGAVEKALESAEYAYMKKLRSNRTL